MATGGKGSSLQWVTLFDNMKAAAAGDSDAVQVPDIDKVLAKEDGSGAAKSKKRLSVERIYQKKTQLEHILLRPDTYIGSVEKLTQNMWVYDDIQECMVQKEITFVPGLYKIFDEILVNAADNKQRDGKMSTIKIDIDPENGKIRIWNNGKGIPVVEHKTEKMFVPTLIFGHLLTSSNYDDTQKKVTGGRNGYGAKLCNIFSTKFTVETQCNEYKKAFKQSWGNNMLKAGEPKISPAKGEDYTCVTFYPDLAKFQMECLDSDVVDLFTRRAYDIAAASPGVKVFLNGKRLPIKSFKDYVDLFIRGKVDDLGSPLKLVYEKINDRWEIAVTLSDKGFQQMSFVNSIATTKGGRHVDYVTDQVVTKLIEVIKKKEKKGGITTIKPFQVKSHMWVFVNCLIENPTFDSQTKENMTLQAKSFGSKCSLTDKFANNVSKCGIVESIQSWMKFKAQEKLNKKCSGQKQSKLKGIPKLDDANHAGTRYSQDCTLILTEGDSAKTLAIAGLGVIGRDNYGVFPLKGKVLNVREATHKQIMENAEINNVIKILGLRYKEKYDTPESMKTLRYGKIMIMTDQDQDGSHIKGLLVNFIHFNWPGLLKQKFLEEFITPIVKVTKSKQSLSFYSLPEFEEWKKGTDNWHTWKVKYYKGLGTSTSKEAKEYFSDMQRHRIPFKYSGTEDDASIVLAFSKKKVEERKEWLTNWMEERKRRAQLDLPELYLYGKETSHITYNEFINRELVLFSNMDNERSIPSLVDGLKPGQRKVLFTCFKRNVIKEIKVAQLAGAVGEHSAYHHGEMSLMGTIINLAQNYVGSNNINMLQPIGQFGTRLHGGKDAASPRYIFTALSPLARLIFNPNDEPLLKSNFDDGQKIEPEWYIPCIPMVLVNGAEGIGTGWSTKIHNYDPRELVNNIRRLLAGQETRPMLPSFKNFQGIIESVDEFRCVCYGEVSVVDDNTIEITELPIRTWTQAYKESVLEPMLQGTDKQPALLQDYKEYHTDVTVKFVVKMTPEKLAWAEDQGLHKLFKLQSSMTTTTMVLFDGNGCIKRYNNVDEILREFFDLRLEYYIRRKDYLEGMLAAESLRLDNQARFICEKIEGTIVIENKPKKELIQLLVRRGYDSDPVKTWKEAQSKLQLMEENGVEDEEGDGDSLSSSSAGGGPDFNYILSMALWCLTKEKKEELLKQRDAKAEELYKLRKKTPKDLWHDDLNILIKELDALEQKEKAEDSASVSVQTKTSKGRAKIKKLVQIETKPSPVGRRVEPRIDPSLKAKSEAAVAKKQKALAKKEKQYDAVSDILDDEDEAPKSLADRLGSVLKDEKGTKAKKPAVPRQKKPPKEKKSPTKRSPTKGSPKKKGEKKRNPWSDDDEGEDSDISHYSDYDNDDSFVVPARDVASRRTAVKKYTFSDDSEEESNHSDAIEDMDDNVHVQENNAPPAYNIDSSDEDDPPAPVASKPKPSANKRVFPDSDSDSDSDIGLFIEEEKKKKEPAKKKTLGKKPSATTAKKGKKNDPKQPTIFAALKTSKQAPISAEVSCSQKPKTQAKPKIRTAVIIDDSDSEAERPFPAGEAKTKAAPKRKKKTIDSDISEDEYSPKKGVKKSRKKAKDSDEDVMPKKKKAPSKPKKKQAVSDDDDDDFMMGDDDGDDVGFASLAERVSRRGAAPAKYNFGDSDDDDEDDMF